MRNKLIIMLALIENATLSRELTPCINILDRALTYLYEPELHTQVHEKWGSSVGPRFDEEAPNV